MPFSPGGGSGVTNCRVLSTALIAFKLIACLTRQLRCYELFTHVTLINGLTGPKDVLVFADTKAPVGLCEYRSCGLIGCGVTFYRFKLHAIVTFVMAITCHVINLIIARPCIDILLVLYGVLLH